jgi:hypothetical protein
MNPEYKTRTIRHMRYFMNEAVNKKPRVQKRMRRQNKTEKSESVSTDTPLSNVILGPITKKNVKTKSIDFCNKLPEV